MDATRVLLVERDPDTRLTIEARLRAAGHAVYSAGSEAEALALLGCGGWAAMLGDLRPEELAGTPLLARARALDPDLELIVVAEAPTLETAIAALACGARGYLRRPIADGELEEQVAAAMVRRRLRCERDAALVRAGGLSRRLAEAGGPEYTVAAPPTPLIRLGALEIDDGRRSVVVGGIPVRLSSGEYRLLRFLAGQPDRVHSAELLVSEVMGWRCAPDESRELIKARVHRLRKKIALASATFAQLVSVRGEGYMLCSQQPAAELPM